MDVSLFLFLPVEDAVLDIPPTKEALSKLFTPLLQLKSFAKMQGISLKIFFDQENILQFKADLGEVLDDGSYLDKPSTLLRHFVGSHSSDVNKTQMLDSDCSYIRWDTLTCTTDANVPLVIKSAFESPEATCVLSISHKQPDDYFIVSIIKDRAYREGLPELKKIPLFFSADECVEWLSSLLHGHFSPLGNSDFIRTSFHWNNQSIFKRISDGSFWYFDFFHRENKIHYDVFDQKGDHLGEASVDGYLMEGTKDKTKSIRHILHGT